MDISQIDRLNLTRSEMIVVRELLSLALSEIARLDVDPVAKLAALERRDHAINYAAVMLSEDASEQQAMLLREKRQFRESVFASARLLLLLPGA